MRTILIAVDGPAASGKGTLARRLAQAYELPYLDTGALYRAVARDVLATGAKSQDLTAAKTAAGALDLDTLDDPALRHQGIGAAASQIAQMKEVRTALMAFQRQIAADPKGAVLDGRDIGTVICPDALVKLFVTANPETRARRRFEELQRRGENLTFDAVLADIHKRDQRDQNRDMSPLRPALDAHLLNTTNLSIEDAYKAARTHVEFVINAAGCAS